MPTQQAIQTEMLCTHCACGHSSRAIGTKSPSRRAESSSASKQSRHASTAFSRRIPKTASSSDWPMIRPSPA